MEELGVVCVIYMQKTDLHCWWELGHEKNNDKLVELLAFVDTVGIKS